MITRENFKKAGKMTLRVFITASISVGAVSFKNGKALLMIEDVSDRLEIGDSGKILLVLLGSSGVIYTLAFTRLPSFWKKFNFESNSASSANNDDHLLPAYKSLRTAAYIIWVARAPFNLLNTYIGSQTLLRYIGVEPDTLPSITISIYSALANQVSYDVYTFKSIFANFMRLAKPSSSEINEQENYYSKLALKCFMDLGTLSFSSLSFFLTKESLRSIPISRDNFSNKTIFALSGASALSAFFSEIFSKNLDLHHLIDQGYDNFIKI